MPDLLTTLANDLKLDEGWRAHVYRDTLGFDTIGYGFLVDSRKGGGLPKPVAEFWLNYEIERKWLELTTRIPWVLEQPEQVQLALGNMAYQMGVDGVLGFRNMLDALQRGDRALAAHEAANSRWAMQTPNRARRVIGMIRG